MLKCAFESEFFMNFFLTCSIRNTLYYKMWPRRLYSHEWMTMTSLKWTWLWRGSIKNRACLLVPATKKPTWVTERRRLIFFFSFLIFFSCDHFFRWYEKSTFQSKEKIEFKLSLKEIGVKSQTVHFTPRTKMCLRSGSLKCPFSLFVYILKLFGKLLVFKHILNLLPK